MSTQSARLSGKIAVVTGGTAGIGLASAIAFAEEGAKVFVTGRRQGELDEAVAKIGHGAVGIRGDVSKLDEIDRLYAAVGAAAGRIDVLFANAGGGTMLPLADITEEHFDSIFDLNVKGLLFTVQKALPLLVDGASVILGGSTTSTVGTAAFSVYSASKAAVRNFARSWALDLKERHIRVNTLSPGPTLTPGLVGLAPNDDAKAGLLAYLASQVPLGRVADPMEIGRAAVFLASSDASYVNGIELFVDGGQAQV